MIVEVLRTDLDGIMINIADSEFIPNPVDAHRFKLKICHCPRCILSKSLVYPYLDAFPCLENTIEKMSRQDLGTHVFCHK